MSGTPGHSGTSPGSTAHRFQPGQSGNPGGYPQSRRKLTRKFCDAFYADFEKHGEKAIKALREDDPVAYCQMIVDMMPAETKLNVTPSPELERLSGDISWLRGAIESARSKAEIENAMPERPLLPAPVRVQSN